MDEKVGRGPLHQLRVTYVRCRMRLQQLSLFLFQAAVTSTEQAPAPVARNWLCGQVGPGQCRCRRCCKWSTIRLWRCRVRVRLHSARLQLLGNGKRCRLEQQMRLQLQPVTRQPEEQAQAQKMIQSFHSCSQRLLPLPLLPLLTVSLVPTGGRTPGRRSAVQMGPGRAWTG